MSNVPPQPLSDIDVGVNIDVDTQRSVSLTEINGVPAHEGAEPEEAEAVEATAEVAGRSLGSAVIATIEWVLILVGAVGIALLMRAFLFQAFWIPSESMETTLMTNDRVLVNKVSYHLHDIERGDVIVFARPEDQPGEIRDLIKRVVGLPGDTIEGRGNTVYVNGQRLVEPYLTDEIFTSDFGPVEIPEGELFVMGDNRSHSFDSRFFGPIPEDDVTGRAFALFWPLDRIGTL